MRGYGSGWALEVDRRWCIVCDRWLLRARHCDEDAAYWYWADGGVLFVVLFCWDVRLSTKEVCQINKRFESKARGLL